MRSRLLPFLAVAFMAACADGATSPLLQPGEPRLYDNPPPPWAEVEGDISEDGTTAQSIAPLMSVAGRSGPRATHAPSGSAGTYVGWLLVAPGDRTAWLRFTSGDGVTFSPGARIMKAGEKVSGSGTVTINGHTYQLSSVTEFEYSRDCTNPVPTNRASCASFSGDGFSSSAAVWTGRLANDGGTDTPPDWDDGKPGKPDDDDDEVCYECVEGQ